MNIYLDCNATTPIEPDVAEVVSKYTREEYGNAASRTHDFGSRAKRAVQHARGLVAKVVSAKQDEVIFTSGATESNNIALLGLAEHGKNTRRLHIVSSQIEHKAVLEPLEELQHRGFEVTLVPADRDGSVDPHELKSALRPETLLVSVMHVNNETGVIQPIAEVADVLEGHDAFFHVDAAQGFGKDLEPLRNARLDLISVSSHKIYGPKGVGALIARRRGFDRPPLKPLMHGGGHEKGLRPGTLPVPLVAGFGRACQLALENQGARQSVCRAFRERVLAALSPLDPVPIGAQERVLSHTLNFRIAGVDAEAAMVSLKGLVAASNGSACTSADYTPSHVLLAMGLTDVEAQEAIRFSWCHLTEEPDWDEIRSMLARLK